MNQIRSDLFAGSANKNDLTITYDGFVVTDATWGQPPLPAPATRLYYVKEGSGMLLTDTDERMVLEPGYVYIAPCGMKVGFYGTPSVTKLFFHVNVILPDGYDIFSFSKHFDRLPRTIEYIDELTSWYLGNNAVNYAMLKGEIWNTVSEFALRITPPERRMARYSPLVTKAIAYIKSNLSATLTATQVAEAAFCSVSTLGTAFKREIGSTPAKYIEDLLLFEAHRMLISTDLSVGDISAKLGYCDQFYFSRCFTRKYSVSPRAYRKQQSTT